MTTVQAELFTDAGNNAVVRLPGRRFPGVLVQGDALNILVGTLAEIAEALEKGETRDAELIAKELRADLEEMKSRYESALQEHGIPLPY